jgi:hypothetical protein
LPSISCSVLFIKEENAKEDIKPLEWVLLCDKDILTFEEALDCIKKYTARWLVEEFHKALKTGLGAEDLQLETAKRLHAAIAIMSVVALRLIDMRNRLRIHPQKSASASGLSDVEIQILEKYLKRPLLTVQDVNLAIGRLGGHLNRKSDGMPGILTLWRGMKKLYQY